MQPLTFHDDLKRFARSLTGKSDNEDLIQTTYLKAYSNLDKFDGQNMKGWLFTIMRNEFINELKKPIRKKTVDIPVEIAGNYLLIEDNLLSSLYANDLKQFINRTINDRAKIVFWMYFEGYKDTEISQRENVSPTTVRSRMYDLRAKLTKKMRHVYQ